MEKGGWGYLSFTALDRINEIEFALKNKMYQSALALTLTLPDICMQIATSQAIAYGAIYNPFLGDINATYIFRHI